MPSGLGLIAYLIKSSINTRNKCWKFNIYSGFAMGKERSHFAPTTSTPTARANLSMKRIPYSTVGVDQISLGTLES